MKRCVFVLVLLAVAGAAADTAWIRRAPPHVEWFGKPLYIDVLAEVSPGVFLTQRLWDPSDAVCRSNGWESYEYGGVPDDAVWDPAVPVAVRDMTQEELDARAADRAAAADAAVGLAGPPPEVFVPALDDAGNVVGSARLVVRAATWDLIPLTNSASPQRAWLVQSNEYVGKVAKMDARRNGIREAKAKGNKLEAVSERVDALEANAGVEQP